MLLFKINEKFGFDLYSQISNSLFYIIVIISFVTLVSSIVKKDKIITIVGMLICFTLCIYMFSRPETFLDTGDYIYNLFFQLLKNLEKKDITLFCFFNNGI